MRAVALILAAGRGARLGAEQPKAHVYLGGQSVLARSAMTLGSAACVSHVLPVVGPDARSSLDDLALRWRGPAELLEAVRGGATRQASLARGLAALRECVPAGEWVLVHDAARCLVEAADAEQVLDCARTTGAAIPVVPVIDTLKEVKAGRVVATVERARLGRAQTPQAFRVQVLADALARAESEGFAGTDCASLVERLGVEVAVCAGREANRKLTTREDRVEMEALLAARDAEAQSQARGGGAA